MAFIYNGRIPENIKYNGFNVSKIIYNNELVWAKKRLPDEYQEVEYIESSGTQYINTGIIPDNNTDAGIIVSDVNETSAQIFVASSFYRIAKFNASQKVSATIGSTSITSDSSGANKFKAEIINKTFYLDGVAIGSSSDTVSTPLSLEIFRGNYGTAQYYSRFKCYGAYIKQNGEFVLNLIPCYRKSDDEIGFYDLINNEFLTNAGTGIFNKGNDVIVPRIPTTYQELDYIESSGTQYIDTGIAPNNNTKVKIKFFNNSLSSWYIYGSRDNDYFVFTQTGSTTNDTIFARIGDIRSETGWKRQSAGAIYESELETKTDVFDYTITDLTNEKTYTDLNVSYVPISGTVPDIFIFAIRPETIQSGTTRLYYFKLYQDGKLVRNFVPCYRKSDNVVGLYDIANSRKNLLNPEEIEQGGIYDATGLDTTSTTRVRTPYVEVLDNTFYTISNSLYTIRMDLNNVAYIHCYDSNKNYLGVANNQTRYNEKAYTFKTLTNTKYIRAVFQKSDSSSTITIQEVKSANPMIEQNNTLTSYEPYDGFYTNAGTGTFDKGEDI